MYAGRDFSPSDPGESESYTFDFVKDFAAGETITAAEWTCSVAQDSAGVDGDAATRVVGSPAHSGTTTSQRIEGLLPGVKYVLEAEVTTSAGNTRSLWSHIECVLPQ